MRTQDRVKARTTQPTLGNAAFLLSPRWMDSAGRGTGLGVAPTRADPLVGCTVVGTVGEPVAEAIVLTYHIAYGSPV